MNLRKTIRRQNKRFLEGTTNSGYGIPIVLISPDGIIYNIRGRVVYSYWMTNDQYGTSLSNNIGQDVLVNLPVITINKESTTRIPIAGENWIIKIPKNPLYEDVLSNFTYERPPENNDSIGFVKIYLVAIEQDDIILECEYNNFEFNGNIDLTTT